MCFHSNYLFTRRRQYVENTNWLYIMSSAGDAELVNGEVDNVENGTNDAALLSNEKKHDKAACADLEKITDYEEDIEVKNIDNAISLIEGRRSQENIAKTAREKELSQIKVKKEDIELIVNEMEISQSLAERKLRESGGDVVQALLLLTDWLIVFFN